FDRDLDTKTVNPSTIVFSPAASWTWSYTAATKTLTIVPAALESLTAYTVTVTSGVKGTDGCQLQDGYTITFTTKRAPAGTITIAGGADYSASPVVTLDISYNADVTDMRWSLTKADITNDPSASILNWQTKATTISGFTLAGGDGPKTVYIQFRDADDNVTSGTDPISDAIILDTAAPVFTSFTIDNGDVSAPTTAVTLTSSVSDPTSGMEMRVQNLADGTSWGPWQDYAASLPWTLSSWGTRVVNVQYRDKAGNTDGITHSDAIIAGAPSLTILMNDHANGATPGNIYASWTSPAAPDAGTDTYYLSWRNNDPQGPWYQWTSTTDAFLLFACGTEVICDFAVQLGNTAAGGISATMSNVRSGFTSNITIVYNDRDATDTALASTLKTVLKNSNGWVAANAVVGSMPTWSVTLVPQGFVSTTYASGNRVWGYPLIVTPGVTSWESASWVKNLTVTGKGMILMGEGGARVLDTINANYYSASGRGWYKSASGQPADIGWAKSALCASNNYTYAQVPTSGIGMAIWSSPLSYFTINDGTLCWITATSPAHPLQKAAVNRSTGVAPTGGDLYAKDYASAGYYDVVRQYRFVQYGFYGLADRPTLGLPFFVNLVHVMSDVNFP
ncbi:MAG TPA: Ig-like domain-containing protein, partial [Acidimicrobiales bacterium]|nr:Ig-like domain-containing protein [Acidimicrobiales bacterium]